MRRGGRSPCEGAGSLLSSFSIESPRPDGPAEGGRATDIDRRSDRDWTIKTQMAARICSCFSAFSARRCGEC
jgi:hypothetical protein